MRRDFSMSQMLNESRCGTERSHNLPSQTPPTQIPTTRNFGLSEMLEAALETSENKLPTDAVNPKIAELEELKKALPMIIRSAFHTAMTKKFSEKDVKRGYGLGDMLADATRGSG